MNAKYRFFKNLEENDQTNKTKEVSSLSASGQTTLCNFSKKNYQKAPYVNHVFEMATFILLS